MYHGEEREYGHHGEHSEERNEGHHGEDCGCGGHGQRGHHGMMGERRHHGEDCGCGGHGGEGMRHEGTCGCGGHGHLGMRWGGMPHPGCTCPWHMQGMAGAPIGMMHGRMGMGGGMAMGFGRRFISREEIIGRLEEYKKQLEAEAKGVEEHIAELKKTGESIQA